MFQVSNTLIYRALNAIRNFFMRPESLAELYRKFIDFLPEVYRMLRSRYMKILSLLSADPFDDVKTCMSPHVHKLSLMDFHEKKKECRTLSKVSHHDS